jgi:hypothetical protein
MKTHAASILHLAPIRAMRSFTMKRLLVFLGFSLVGVLLSFADALQVEQGVVIVMFMLVGFVGSLVIEDRQSTRFPIIMHAVYEYTDSSSGEGVVQDVSINGCRVRSTKPAQVKAELRLQFYPAGQALPIEIQQAVVRWCGDGEFGVQFRRVEHAHEERLQQLVSELPKQACHWCEG